MSQSFLLCLVGPTAVGKSAVALEWAQRIHAEIVSADSMQVYCGMDIGTAKPTTAERKRVPHHLIDVAEITESFHAARYRALALAAIADIRRRGKIPLIVGGSGMYLRALTEGLFTGPGANPKLRSALEQEAETVGSETLHARLAQLDADAARKISPGDRRRIVRALEVISLTQQPISRLRTQWGKECGVGDVLLIGLSRSREDLYQRIGARVEQMFAQGLVEEVRLLLKKGLEQNSTAMQAVGYKEVVEFLHGKSSLEDARERVARHSQQLAKRQLTWFRHQVKVTWVDVKPEESMDSIVTRVQGVFVKASAQALGK